MAFCSNCGTKLNFGEKFCHECGAKVITEDQNPNTRKEEYAGTILKCPSCGAEISSLDAICPACGHEINSIETCDALIEFSKKINKYETMITNSGVKKNKGWSTWPVWQKIVWVILNIYLFCIPLLIKKIVDKEEKSPLEDELSSIIENFTFPKERKATIDSLLYIKSKILFITNHSNNPTDNNFLKCWFSKAEQIKSSADIILPNDKNIEDIYKDIKNEKEIFLKQEKKIKRKKSLKKALNIILIILLFPCIFCLAFCSYNPNVDTDVKFTLPNSPISTLVPDLETNNGELQNYDETSINLDLYNINNDDFLKIINNTKDKGYIYEISESKTSFFAKDKNNNKIVIYFYEELNELNIHIKTPLDENYE